MTKSCRRTDTHGWDDAALIARAEEVAASVPGVTHIVNRMVAAAMFDFD